MSRNSTSAGLGLAVLSAGTFGTAGPFAGSLLAVGWTPGGAVTVRIAGAALVLTLPALFLLRGRWAQVRGSLGAIVAYGFGAVGIAQLCFFNAIEHVSVGVALLLEYSGTLLVVLWMWLRHGQRPSRLTITGGLVAIAGLVLVLDLTGPQKVDLVGVLWGLGAATGLATYFVVSAHANDHMPPVAMAWAGMVVAAVTLAFFALVGVIPFRTGTADVRLAGHTFGWFVPVLGVALVATVTAYSTGIAAARRLGARVASFVGLAEVLAAILFSWLLLGQQPGLHQLIGGLVVIAGIVLVRLGDAAEIPADESDVAPLLLGDQEGGTAALATDPAS